MSESAPLTGAGPARLRPGRTDATRRRRWWLGPLLGLPVAAVFAVAYARAHPLVFMGTHAHCIKQAGLALLNYAAQHGGRFPYSAKGYPDALLLDEDFFHALTGPGYDPAALLDAKQEGRELREEECGRVYVQGLTTRGSSDLAVLFDKLPTPGGDHCALPVRLWAPLAREVCMADGSMTVVPESEWPQFAAGQVELLVKEGFDRAEAERLYGLRGKE
jgi:hypothetical protein